MKEKEKRKKKGIFEIFFRYFLLLVLGVKIKIFYFLFAPITFFFFKILLGLSYNVEQYGNFIFFDGTVIELIEACIATSAYYLLAILNLTTRNIGIIKRIKMFLLDIFIFLFLNIIRIYILAILYAKNIAFYFFHIFFFYFVSFFLVFAIWIVTIKIFDIKEVPVYGDFCFLRKKAKAKKLLKKQQRCREK